METRDNPENRSFSGLLKVTGSGRRKLTSDLNSTGQNTQEKKIPLDDVIMIGILQYRQWLSDSWNLEKKKNNKENWPL